MIPMEEKLTSLFAGAIGEGVFSGASLVVGVSGRKVFEGAWGTTSFHQAAVPVTSQTFFDLASLTKPVATATLFMILYENKEIALEDPLPRFFPRWLVPADKRTLTLEALLSHRSGLPAYRPYYRDLSRIPLDRRRDTLLHWILREPLEQRPGARRLYSDLGYLLLGWILEEVSGMPLHRLFEERIAAPLDIGLGFRLRIGKERREPAAAEGPSVAATERCPWRGRILQGEVHDENAYCLGGVAGHAGLFGSADHVWRWLQALWVGSPPPGNVSSIEGASAAAALTRNRDDLSCPLGLSAETVRFFWNPRRDAAGEAWSLGFDHPSGEAPAAGRFFSTESVGHLGFTGTSFWLDPTTGIAIILLTNRVHPSRNDERIRAFRPLVHDTVVRALTGCDP